jgi:(S)-ureidoglycine-glyoxylate aminotransferase
MELRLFGDPAYKMPNVTGVWIPEGVDGNRVRARVLEDFSIEIGTSFGPLHGKVWRIGTMGYNARQDAVLVTLAALDATLAAEGWTLPRGAGVDAACDVYRNATAASRAN